MSLPRYPEYKPSGVEWLGEVPAAWRVQRLKHVSAVMPSNVDKKSYDDELFIRLCNYTDVYYNEKITANIDFMQATASEEQLERFQLQADDIVITKDSEEADDIAISAYVPETLPGVVCGYHLALIRPREGCDGRYIKRLFDSHYLKSCVAVSANGLTRVGLSQYALDNLEIPFPPLAEQAAIAAFLDRETAKIDAMVAEQESLIALLKEKRQAMISYAVTRGLNPDVPMKPSGIEWLGNVPTHWNRSLLKRCFRSVDYGISDSLQPEGGIAVLRMGNLQNGKIVTDDLKYVDTVDPALLLEDGDLLFNRTNSIDLIGKVGRFLPQPTPTSFASYLVRLRVAPNGDPGFFSYLLNMGGLLGLVRASAFVAIGQCNLNPTRYGELEVVVPSLDEQRRIAASLDAETARLGNLIEQSENAIVLLKERRSALISAAVTGQIDTRHAA